MRKDEKRILKISILIVAIVEILLICLFSYIHYRKYHYIPKDEKIANINGLNIYKVDIENRLQTLFSNEQNIELNKLDPELFKALILEKYYDEAILKLAKKQGITKNKYYKFISQEYFNRLVREEYLNKNIFNKITEEDIKHRYDELVSITKNKEERKISHILVETEEEARRVRNIVSRLNSFEKIAKQRSLDSASAINGGNLGYLIKEEITIKEFADIAFLLKEGEISRPVQTQEGWHIIKVDDIRKMSIKTYEESKSDIYEELKSKEFEKFINSILNKREIEKIKVFIDFENQNIEKQGINEIIERIDEDSEQ